MGELRCYVITMIDEHSNYALAQAVPSLNCDIIKLFFCRADRLFPIDINQGIADTVSYTHLTLPTICSV